MKSFQIFSFSFIFVLLLAVALITVLVFKEDNSKSDTTGSRVSESLQFVVVISRHGNRGGHEDYYNDPYPLNSSQYWPYGSDGLTPYGRVQMYNLGVKVRSLYNGFLNSTFYTDELHASSTCKDRVVMSGEAFLAGLYPPRGFQIWNKNIPWQPTPLYSDSPDKTLLLSSCPKYVVECSTVKASFLAKYAANISVLGSYYNDVTGENVTGDDVATHLYYLWDKLVSEDDEGYTVPKWTTQLYPEPLKDLMAKEYLAFYAGTNEIVKLLAGNLFGQIIDVMKSKINGSLPLQKIQYYSGHDTTILALQVLLGIHESDVIGIVSSGSGMILELHENSTSGQFTIQTLYINGSSSDLSPTTLTSPVCGDPCDFYNLDNNTRQFTNVSFEQECQTSEYFKLTPLQKVLCET